MTITNEKEAIEHLADLACRWGENEEESLPKRLGGGETDQELRDLVTDGGAIEFDEYEFERAQEVRDTWAAITILQNAGLVSK